MDTYHWKYRMLNLTLMCLLQKTGPNHWNQNDDTSCLHAIIRPHHFDFDVEFLFISELMLKIIPYIEVLSVIYANDHFKDSSFWVPVKVKFKHYVDCPWMRHSLSIDLGSLGHISFGQMRWHHSPNFESHLTPINVICLIELMKQLSWCGCCLEIFRWKFLTGSNM